MLERDVKANGIRISNTSNFLKYIDSLDKNECDIKLIVNELRSNGVTRIKDREFIISDSEITELLDTINRIEFGNI